MNPAFKIGQLFITGIPGLYPEDDTLEILNKINAGGVILFRDNYESPAQVAELSNRLQRSRGELPPFFISVDHEGGSVWRFKDLTKPPSMEEVGKLDSPKFTFSIHEMMANELKAIGVNLDFSPVADVNTNPNCPIIGKLGRSFSSDPENVAKHASAATRGLQKTGVISCLKHFPGHGDTTKDSHKQLPVINKSWEELEKCELIPFAKGIKSKAEMVMTAHILNKAVDPDEPATFSKKTLDYLRNTLRFSGVIISDDLEMDAVTDGLSPGERALKALNAGCNQICFKTLPVASEAHAFLLQAFEKGDLAESLLDDSLRKINSMRERYVSGKEVYVPDVAKLVGSEKSIEILNSMGRENIS